MMKKGSLLALVAISASLIGCSGGDASAPKEDEAAFKAHSKDTLTAPPADAMKPPAGFKSSLDGPGPGQK